MNKVPHRLSVEFTNECNFSCIMCPQSVYGQRSREGNIYTREKGYLSNEVFEVFLANARKYAKSVSVSFFGEQMLHPKFTEYMTELAELRSYKLILFSNFSLFDQHIFPAVMRCDVLKISLDASSDELFSRVCPTGDYYSIEASIRSWLAVKKHPKTYLVYTTSSLNRHDKQSFLKKWLPMLSKNDGVITKSVISYGGVMRDEHMTPNQCRVLQKPRLVVSWNGEVSPCNLDVNMDMSAGNIMNTGDLADIVNSEQYRDVLNDIRHKYRLCAACFDANNHQKTVIHRGQKNA